MRISDWSSDVCSSDLDVKVGKAHPGMRESIDVRRRIASAEGADVAEPPVVGDEDHDIGVRRLGLYRRRGVGLGAAAGAAVGGITANETNAAMTAVRFHMPPGGIAPTVHKRRTRAPSSLFLLQIGSAQGRERGGQHGERQGGGG